MHMRFAVSAITLLCAFVASDAKPQKAELPDAAKAVVAQILKVNGRNEYLMGPENNCTAGKNCPPIDVTVTETVDTNDTSKVVGCVVTLGNIKVSRGSSSVDLLTKVTFNLKFKGKIKADYAFRSGGIVVVSQDQTGMISSPNVVTELQAVFQHKYSAGAASSGKTATFFPIVVQKIGGQDVFLCGAGDPKIVNG